MRHYARQEGINYEAIKRIYPSALRGDAVSYISEHGLSSLKFKDTCRAVKEFERANGLYVSREGAEIWD